MKHEVWEPLTSEVPDEEADFPRQSQTEAARTTAGFWCCPSSSELRLGIVSDLNSGVYLTDALGTVK